MDVDTAIAVLERHKQLPEADRQAAIDDPASEYWQAKARGGRYLADLGKIESAAARAKQAAHDAAVLRRSQLRQLRSDLDTGILLLAGIDSSASLSANDVQRIAKVDGSAATLMHQLGIEVQLAAPHYAGAVTAWTRGETLNLSDTRRAQCDVILEGLK